MSSNNNTVFIGKKPLMTYVTSAIVQLASLPSITLKARGQTIVTAVNVAQIIIKKTDAFEIGQIKISSESLESSDGRKRDVSTIEIPVSKMGQ